MLIFCFSSKTIFVKETDTTTSLATTTNAQKTSLLTMKQKCYRISHVIAAAQYQHFVHKQENDSFAPKPPCVYVYQQNLCFANTAASLGPVAHGSRKTTDKFHDNENTAVISRVIINLRDDSVPESAAGTTPHAPPSPPPVSSSFR